VRVLLSFMMFVQFFIWGAWYVVMGTYLDVTLHFSPAAIAAAYSAPAWGAIFAPFFIGMVADRYFRAEHVLAVLQLLSAVLLFAITKVADSSMFFPMLLAFSLCYMPTLALVNAIAFHQMSDIAKEFPSIRVMGTLGWIVANLIVGWMKVEDQSTPFLMGAGAALLLGLFAFALPTTPPKAAGKSVSFGQILGTDSLALLKDRSFAVFVVGSLLICIPLSFYYNWANNFLNYMKLENAAGKMSMGQMSEVFFMIVMPFFFFRLGVKKMLLVGMLFWVLRYVCFAFGNSENLIILYYLGILFHGICYDFFFVTGQIYVDKRAPEEIRASAQGFIALITYGVGMVIGTNFSGWIVGRFTAGEVDAAGAAVRDWQSIWLVPAGMAFVIMVIFALLFSDKGVASEKAESRAT
jgi:nucleoside transporter